MQEAKALKLHIKSALDLLPVENLKLLADFVNILLAKLPALTKFDYADVEQAQKMPPQRSQRIQLGAFRGDPERMSTMEDFAIAEWRPTDRDLDVS